MENLAVHKDSEELPQYFIMKYAGYIKGILLAGSFFCLFLLTMSIYTRESIWVIAGMSLLLRQSLFGRLPGFQWAAKKTFLWMGPM